MTDYPNNPCAACDHDKADHDYSNPSSDFSHCEIAWCSCEDWKEARDYEAVLWRRRNGLPT